MEKKRKMIIKFAIVGCGRIAQRHAEHINNTDGCVLVACCDIEEIKAENLAEKYNASFSNSIDEMLKIPDIDIFSLPEWVTCYTFYQGASFR